MAGCEKRHSNYSLNDIWGNTSRLKACHKKRYGGVNLKRLTCEMCGGTDLIKQDGVFVCQACGMKYSVEDAKKMMIEGTVEVQGVVAVKNTAQLENLLRLAQSSYESKNYAQAEEFCNQVIAMDSANYEAWKIKGEAINFQITGTNDRITEVYNCIMTSYKVLDEAGKDEHREEILASLRGCLEGEIDFAFNLFKSNRPSDSMLNKVKNTFVQCASNVITSYEELGYSEDEADEYRTYIKNYFIDKTNTVCESTWDDVVYYNYYRGGWNDEFHPDEGIRATYVSEGDNLIELLRFAEKYFTNETPLTVKRENYRLQNRFQSKLIDATSYKRMVSTTTNGYGAVVSRREYWEVDKSFTESAKAARNKDVSRTCALYDKVESEMAKSDPKIQARLLEEWRSELNSIDTSFKFSCGGSVALIIFLALTIACFTIVREWCGDSYSFVSTIFGVACAFIVVFGLYNEIKNARNRQEENQAKADRLRRKINEIT